MLFGWYYFRLNYKLRCRSDSRLGSDEEVVKWVLVHSEITNYALNMCEKLRNGSEHRSDLSHLLDSVWVFFLFFFFSRDNFPKIGTTPRRKRVGQLIAWQGMIYTCKNNKGFVIYRDCRRACQPATFLGAPSWFEMYSFHLETDRNCLPLFTAEEATTASAANLAAAFSSAATAARWTAWTTTASTS